MLACILSHIHKWNIYIMLVGIDSFVPGRAIVKTGNTVIMTMDLLTNSLEFWSCVCTGAGILFILLTIRRVFVLQFLCFYFDCCNT